MTAGFVAVFGAFGLLAAPLATVAHRVLPWVTIAVGLAVAVVGALLVAGRSIHLTLPVVATRARLSAVGFGMAFALASLSCTIGPFLALVTAGFRTRSVAEGIGAYLAYALGMGAVIAVVSVIVAAAIGAARAAADQPARRCADPGQRTVCGLVRLVFVARAVWRCRPLRPRCRFGGQCAADVGRPGRRHSQWALADAAGGHDCRRRRGGGPIGAAKGTARPRNVEWETGGFGGLGKVSRVCPQSYRRDPDPSRPIYSPERLVTIPATAICPFGVNCADGASTIAWRPNEFPRTIRLDGIPAAII
jgi:hypothetical protein